MRDALRDNIDEDERESLLEIYSRLNDANHSDSEWRLCSKRDIMSEL
jgi:hypothetical protein